jgi:puromycin-sensitive aminopeptidase
MNKKSVRLPNHITPIKYQISITPDLENFVFSGEETVELNLKKDVYLIFLHCKEIKIEYAEAVHQNKKFGDWAIKISYKEKDELAVLKFNKKVQKGKILLKLSFVGVLNDKLRGFYRSNYLHEGKQKHLATTQFEATDARRAFPCFDEPAKKAVFEINLIVPKNLTAISNTLPVEVEEKGHHHKIVKFAPTPVMSTYLLAFIVGDFEYVEGWAKKNLKSNSKSKSKTGKNNKVLVRVYTTPGKKHQAKFALECGIRMLEFFNGYFQIPYPLNTLDLIAIPDFAHGAMENWGAITYRETALLIDEDHSSAATKQQVALTIAHEIAHQWFGNLVTMKWWTHLWLNEGFASYIEYLAVDHQFPAWDIWTQFANNDLSVAFKLDAFKNTHPVEVEVHHPNEISEIFDAISYSKGASIIRMLAGFLGEEKFRQGLRLYLKTHSYKNASTEHLWRAFEDVSKLSVGKIMKDWTGKPGYPIVKVDKIDGNLEISQQRFSFSEQKESTLWNIPLSINSGKEKQQLIFSKKKIKIKSLKGAFNKFNSLEKGLYRVWYSEKMLFDFKSPIAKKEFSPIERWGIIKDAFALADAGEIKISRALELAKDYKTETEYVVWEEIISSLDEISQLVYGTKIQKEFFKYCLEIVGRILKSIDFYAKAKEAHQRTLLRGLILNFAGKLGHKYTIKKLEKIFANKKIHPDIRGAVYNIKAFYGNGADFEIFKKMYKCARLQEEQRRVGRAMANFKSENEVRKFLKFSLSAEVRQQDAPLLLAVSLNLPQSRELAWKFIKKNWKILLERYGSGGHLLARIIQPLWYFHSNKQALEIKNFFKTHSAPGCNRTIQQILEKIENNERRVKRDLGDLKAYFATQS